MQFWALIVDGLRESLDRKIFWVLAGLSGLVVAAMLCIGFHEDHVSFVFGAMKVEDARFNPASELGRGAITTIGVSIMDTTVGTLGILLAVIATAGFIPSFLEQGAIEVTLSKPISRPLLFLGKYVSALVFVFVVATLFIVASFLVIGLRWGVWLPGYLLCIPLMVLLFSFIYCISALVGVRTRSTLAAVFITLGAWFFIAGIQSADDTFYVLPELQAYRNGTVHRAIQVARWVLPKTQDVSYLALEWAGAGSSADIVPSAETPEEEQMVAAAVSLEDRRRKLSPVMTIGSSLLFEAVFVLWGMYIFCRQDF